MELYVTRNQSRYGPYTREQVEAYLANGSLSPSDTGWHSGLEGWRPLADLIPPRIALPPPPVPPLPAPGSPPLPAFQPRRAQAAPGRLDIGRALTCPFQERSWPARIAWLPLAPLVPIFGSILLRGWRLDLVRRVSREDVDILPGARDLGRFLSDGVVLLLMAVLYHLPLFAFVTVFGFSKITSTLEVLWWAVQTFFAEGAAAFWAIVAQVALGLLVDWVAPLLYFVAVWPLHRMAMVRFAITGRLRCFFQVWRNLVLCVRFMPEILLAFFVDFIALRLLRWTARALITIGVGAVIAPLASALYFWTTGHIFGQVAAKVSSRQDLC
jgi:hypothetical protein